MSEVASKESIEAAKGYESLLVPSLFHQWTDWVLDAAAVEKGSRVIDVACGTGVLARRASERVGPSGRVVGVELRGWMPLQGILLDEDTIDDVLTRSDQELSHLLDTDGSVRFPLSAHLVAGTKVGTWGWHPSFRGARQSDNAENAKGGTHPWRSECGKR